MRNIIDCVWEALNVATDRGEADVSKRLSFSVKEQIVQLTGACFWYWNSFHSFLDTCEVPRAMYARYPRDTFNKYQAMRNVLNDLEERGQTVVLNNIISNFYRLRGPVDRDSLDVATAKRLLDEFRDAVGNDPIEVEVERQKAEAKRAAYRDSLANVDFARQSLRGLNSRFLELASGSSHTPQQRGFALEVLFFDLLQLAEFEYSRPYRTPHGEQIDGHFRFEKFDYLVEAKWVSGPAKPEHLAVFDNKIRGKAQSTRGLFLAAEGFDRRAVEKFSGDAPRIVLTTGEDLALVLSGTVDLHDLIRAKIDAMVRHGRIDYSAREML